MKLYVSILVVVFFVSVLSSCAGYDKSPVGWPPPIDVRYYYCAKCNALDGGIYGKGPLKHYRTQESYRCVHHWETIERNKFKVLATQYFNVNWEQELAWWQQ